MCAALLKFMEHHQDDEESIKVKDSSISKWGFEFLKIDICIFFELMMAADYMDIQDLYNLVGETLIDIGEEEAGDAGIDIFGITSDLTPDQEQP